jgi:hypothetical protein
MKLSGGAGVVFGIETMSMKEEQEWKESDATWRLLGETAPKRAGARFADDTVRLVKLLPEADPWWPKVLLPWSPVAVCGLLAAMFLFSGVGKDDGGSQAVVANPDDTWVEIQEAAEDEMLLAAVDHLDEFTDQELVSLIGF